jgi:hypothetical protein
MYNTVLLTISFLSLRIILTSLIYGHSNLASHFFNAIAAVPSESRNGSSSEIDLDIPSEE